MLLKNERFTAVDESSFQEILDKSCAGLWEQHVQYSLRQINKYNEQLFRLEKELDELVLQTNYSTPKKVKS